MRHRETPGHPAEAREVAWVPRLAEAACREARTQGAACRVAAAEVAAAVPTSEEEEAHSSVAVARSSLVGSVVAPAACLVEGRAAARCVAEPAVGRAARNVVGKPGART